MPGGSCRRGRAVTPSRRTFVKGLAVGGAAASMGLLRQTAVGPDPHSAQDPAVLTGTEFDLRIGETPVNFTGRRGTAHHRQRLAARRRCCAGGRATR